MPEPLDSTLKDRRAGRTPPLIPLLLPELRGSKACWAGVETAEPMQRGADQRGMMDRLAAKGIRHLIVPLNGPSEDSCLYARKHIEGGTASARASALYDLDRRDEGAFTRLKFLLEAAASAGLMVGLSLFDAGPNTAAGPFREGGNIQGLSVAQNDSDSSTERLMKALGGAGDWVCSAARGFRGVWIEIFRNARGAPGALEAALSARVAETLARHGQDHSPAQLGPWIATRGTDVPAGKFAAQAAPFDASRTIEAGAAALDFSSAILRAEATDGAHDSASLFKRVPTRRPTLMRFAEGVLETARCDWLWRAFLRGYWPLATLRLNDGRDARVLDAVAAIARFAVAWAGRGALRPCPELLARMDESSGDPPENTRARFAAEDGAGRHFAYFGEPPTRGVALALPPGFYRFYWIDPVSGKTLDRGEGAEGGPRANIPGCADPNAKILVLEPDESPDSMTVW